MQLNAEEKSYSPARTCSTKTGTNLLERGNQSPLKGPKLKPYEASEVAAAAEHEVLNPIDQTGNTSNSLLKQLAERS